MDRNSLERIAAKEVAQLPTLAASLIKSEDKYIIIGRRELIKWLAEKAEYLANIIRDEELKTEAEIGRIEREACALIIDELASIAPKNSWSNDSAIALKWAAKQIRERDKIK